ncbi:exosome component 10 isoform X3 [Pararge aegeria]|uniref:exosome component 10 isoform X3 n=1 Tax=Pararge aegeria TaxID=116150 RepID=UPI0019D2C50B|nr:exosome component 10 isoform X3 [Pararge aegeria]
MMSVALNPEAPEFLPANLESSIETGLTTMCRTIRLSNSLPIGISYKKYEGIPDFNTVTKKFNQNVVYQLNSILVTELPAFKLRENDIEFNMERLTGANDSILDRIYSNIDCLNKGIEPTKHNDFYNPIITTIQVGSTTFTGGKNIILPQLLFKDKVDNSSSLWVPKISDKPNNIKPLALQIHYNDCGEAIGYEHPYETELSLFKPRPEWLERDVEELHMPPPPEETKLTYVSTEEELNELLKHLETVEELGVDLEHHNYRSFQGFTCLIQITTVGGDYVVDALGLREHLHKLNEVFTNPKILKIFHGANNDVQWLQRDFGVYVVGMFDTFQAARELGLPRKSLLALLKEYCDLEIDKTHQLADWRLRPLTEAMMHYARTDTHYLLYVWRRMKEDLFKKDMGSPSRLLAVFENSRKVCCLTYQKEELQVDSHLSIYYRHKKEFNSRQMAALRSLFRWRHEQARTLDESTMYLLPNHMLLALAENLPREVQGVISLCSPTPPFVKQNLHSIHKTILSCRTLPLADETDTPRAFGNRMEELELDYEVHDMLDFDEWEKTFQQDSTGSAGVKKIQKPAATFAEIVSLGLRDPVTPVTIVPMFDDKEKNANGPEDAKNYHVLTPYERYQCYRFFYQYPNSKQIEYIRAAFFTKKVEVEQETVVAETSEPPADVETLSTTDAEQNLRKRRAKTDNVNELSTNETTDKKPESLPTAPEKRPPAEVLLGGLKKKNKNKKSHKKNKRYNVSSLKSDQKDQFSELSSYQNKSSTLEIMNSMPKKNSSRKKRHQNKTLPGVTHQHTSLSKTVSSWKTGSRDSSLKRTPKPYAYENASYIKFLETKKSDTKTHKHKK